MERASSEAPESSELAESLRRLTLMAACGRPTPFPLPMERPAGVVDVVTIEAAAVAGFIRMMVGC